MTKEQAQQVITMLIAAFPRELRPEQVEDTSRVYRVMMRDLDFETVKVAVQRLLATAKRLPTIADIREAMLEVGIGGARSGAEAWGDVLKAVGRYGSYRAPVFADPLVAEAVEAVGWRAICMAEETDAAPRAKFADAYNALTRRSRKSSQIAPGAGSAPALPEAESQRLIGSGTPIANAIAAAMPKDLK